MEGTIKVMGDLYGFPMVEMKGGTVQVDGSYAYPGDDDMKPVATAIIEHGTVYLYPYAMISFRLFDGSFQTYRMD